MRRSISLLSLLVLGACSSENAHHSDETETTASSDGGSTEDGSGGVNDGGASSLGGSGASGDGSGANPEEQLDYDIPACPAGTVGFAEEVIASDFGDGESFGHDALPDIVLGGPRGGGCCSGSLDVASLGNGGSITLGFGERVIEDGPGADFLVFENAFWAGGDESAGFFEFARVEVSEDGMSWVEFPCDGETGEGCAGTSPVWANPLADRVDVFDPEEAGGDAFDLADVGLDHARFVRIVDLPDDGMGFDLDAVAIVHGRCE